MTNMLSEYHQRSKNHPMTVSRIARIKDLKQQLQKQRQEYLIENGWSRSELFDDCQNLWKHELVGGIVLMVEMDNALRITKKRPELLGLGQ